MTSTREGGSQTGSEAPELEGLPEVPGVTHRLVQVGDIRMHVAEAGVPDGPPLLMLHGWPEHWYSWRKVMPLLADRYRLIAPDLRGHGWTDAPPRGYGKEEMADDVARLLDELGLEQVNLVAHDWGGYIGFMLALRHPERVRKYLALNIIHPWLRPGPVRGWPDAVWRLRYQIPIVAPLVPRWAIPSKRFLHKRMLTHDTVQPDVWTEADLEAYRSRFEEPERVRMSARLYRTFSLREITPMMLGRYRKYRLKAPTLLLFGANDHSMATGMLGGFEEYADDMRLELVPDSGHYIAEEKPELVAERALQLFDDA